MDIKEKTRKHAAYSFRKNTFSSLQNQSTIGNYFLYVTYYIL